MLVTSIIIAFSAVLTLAMTTTDTIGLPEQTKVRPGRRLGLSIGLVYLVMFLCAAGLALTGLGTFLTGKAPMEKWILMAHVSVAPPFIICLTLAALAMADRCRRSAIFWLMLLSAVAVILSAVIPMTPLPTQSGQHSLYLIHRYGSIVLASAMVLHLLGLPFQKR